MKTSRHLLLLVALFLFITTTQGQETAIVAPEKTEVIADSRAKGEVSLKNYTPEERTQNKIVAITGVRFTYPLVQKWIDDYNKINPDVQVIIESRGTNDPTKYDILIEAYEPDADKKASRDYLYIGRYAVLPAANSHSAFSKTYSVKGLNRDFIKQLFFHDIFASKSDQATVKAPYVVYTRLQKAGAPIIFSKHFGYQQKDIHGKAIAGADEHLLKALLRDSIGLSYLPLNLLFDQAGKPVEGATILPVDLNGNNKVSEEEKFYSDLAIIIQRLEERKQDEINNVPIEYLNVSIDKNSSNPEAIAFLKWILQNGQNDLHAFGFLKPEQARLEKEKQNEFVLKR